MLYYSFTWLRSLFPLTHDAVWKGTLWLHLWCWAPWLFQFVCCAEPNEYSGSICWLCSQCSWLLPSSNGYPLLFLNHCSSTVSSIATVMYGYSQSIMNWSDTHSDHTSGCNVISVQQGTILLLILLGH